MIRLSAMALAWLVLVISPQFGRVEAQGIPQNIQCEVFAQFADIVMLQRQRGISLSRAIELLEASDMSEELKIIYREISIQAHEYTRFSTEAAQVRAAGDFRSRIHTMCLRDVTMQQLFRN